MTATDPIRLPEKRPHHGGSGHPAYTRAELEELLRLRRQGLSFAAIRKKAAARGWRQPSPACGQGPNTDDGSMSSATEMISVADADADADAGVGRARRGPLPRGQAALPALRALPPAPPAGRCQWPEGDVVRGDFRYCGARTAGVGSYCAAHAARAWREPTDWEERQLQVAAKLLAGSKGR